MRRALQLHLQLTPPAALYCEDAITRAHGAVGLEVGQRVELPFGELDECGIIAERLSQDQIAAWQSYVGTVSFEINDIQPINVTATTVPSDLAPTIVDSQETTFTKDTAAAKSITIKKSIHISNWWYVALGVVLMSYFVFNGPMPKLPKLSKR